LNVKEFEKDFAQRLHFVNSKGIFYFLVGHLDFQAVWFTLGRDSAQAYRLIKSAQGLLFFNCVLFI
jgi:hypothetical protein